MTPTEVPLPGVDFIQSFALAPKGGAILAPNGTVFVFGTTSSGQLGVISPTPTTPVPVVDGTYGMRATSVATCKSAIAIVLEDGALYTAGDNSYTGQGTTSGYTQTLRRVDFATWLPAPAAATGIKRVMSGTDVMYIELNDGSLYVIGVLGPRALTGDGASSTYATRPMRVDMSKWVPAVAAGVRVSSIACGDTNVAVVMTDGTVYTAGSGAVGSGSSVTGRLCYQGATQSIPRRVDMSTSYPVPMAGARIVSAAIGTYHTLLLTDTGGVYGCGGNNVGQLGSRDPALAPSVPTLVDPLSYSPRLASGVPTTVLATGSTSWFVVGGSVYAFGAGTGYLRGDGLLSNVMVPTLLADGVGAACVGDCLRCVGAVCAAGAFNTTSALPPVAPPVQAPIAPPPPPPPPANPPVAPSSPPAAPAAAPTDATPPAVPWSATPSASTPAASPSAPVAPSAGTPWAWAPWASPPQSAAPTAPSAGAPSAGTPWAWTPSAATPAAPQDAAPVTPQAAPEAAPEAAPADATTPTVWPAEMATPTTAPADATTPTVAPADAATPTSAPADATPPPTSGATPTAGTPQAAPADPVPPPAAAPLSVSPAPPAAPVQVCTAQTFKANFTWRRELCVNLSSPFPLPPAVESATFTPAFPGMLRVGRQLVTADYRLADGTTGRCEAAVQVVADPLSDKIDFVSYLPGAAGDVEARVADVFRSEGWGPVQFDDVAAAPGGGWAVSLRVATTAPGIADTLRGAFQRDAVRSQLVLDPASAAAVPASKSLPVGAIVGIAVGMAVLVALAIAVGVFLSRRRGPKRDGDVFAYESTRTEERLL